MKPLPRGRTAGAVRSLLHTTSIFGARRARESSSLEAVRLLMWRRQFERLVAHPARVIASLDELRRTATSTITKSRQVNSWSCPGTLVTEQTGDMGDSLRGRMWRGWERRS